MTHAVNHALAGAIHMTGQQGFYVVVAMLIIGLVAIGSGAARRITGTGSGGKGFSIGGIIIAIIIILALLGQHK